MPKAKSSASKTDGSAPDVEAQLWAAADKLRGHMDTTRTLVRMNLAIRGLRNADNFHESRALDALRDALLLPKLLSGELRVPAAAKFVEASV